jgi:hypothetical protein
MFTVIRRSVEEERAVVRELEPARLPRDGAGERALLVAEELALDQIARDRGAVHADERLVLARAVLVERARDELLAGAALARDEHRARRVRDLLDDLIDLRHRRGLPDEPVAARLARLGADVALAQLARARGLSDHVLELALLERLLMVERAELQRLDRRADGAVRGDQITGTSGKRVVVLEESSRRREACGGR